MDKEKLLKVLTYEVVNGKPVYYRGYGEVLEGKKQPEEVMGASVFHSRLVSRIVAFLVSNLRGYEILSGELGYWVKKGETWRNLDIAVFRYEDVKEKLESEEYIDVPPVMVFEVNVRVEVESEGVYVAEKTQELLGSGVEKVLWIFTRDRKVLVAERDKGWMVKNWNEDIELIEGLKLNIEKLLNE